MITLASPQPTLTDARPATVPPWLDLRLRLAVDAFRALGEERARDPYRGLYVSPEDVETLLGATPEGLDLEAVSRGLMARTDAGDRLDLLAERAGLSTFERNVVAVCAAPELDL